MSFQQKVVFAMCIIAGSVTFGVALLTLLGFVSLQQLAQRSGASMSDGTTLLMVLPIGYFFVAAVIYGVTSFFIRSRHRIVLAITMVAALLHIAIHVMGLSRSLSPILFEGGAGPSKDQFVNVVVSLAGGLMIILLGTYVLLLARTLKSPAP